jgi:hypothetical protein
MCCKVINYLRFFFLLPPLYLFCPLHSFFLISYFFVLFILTSFTNTLSHQLFRTCSITPCLLFCANVYISPCYFTLCLVASPFFLLFHTYVSCLFHRISLAIPTFQHVTSPFKLLPCPSIYYFPLVFHFVLFCASFHLTTSYVTLLFHSF